MEGHSNNRVFELSSFRAFELSNIRAFEYSKNREAKKPSIACLRGGGWEDLAAMGKEWRRWGGIGGDGQGLAAVGWDWRRSGGIGGGRDFVPKAGKKKSTARGGQWIFLFPRQGLFFSLVDCANRNAVPFGLVKHVAYAAALSSDAVSSDFVLVDEEVLDGSCTVLRELVVDFLRSFG